MLKDFQIFLLILAVMQIAFYLVPRRFFPVRAVALILLSHVFILYISPLSFAYLVASEIILVGYVLLARVTGKVKLCAWVATLVMLAISLVLRLEVKAGTLVDVIGSGFVLVRTIGLFWDYYFKDTYDKPLPTLLEGFFLFSFFPAFAAGPVERIATFQDLKAKSRPSLQLYMEGIYRIVTGSFKILFLGNVLVFGAVTNHFTGIEGAVEYGPLMTLSFIALKFAGLYLNFSGVTDIAIGSGRLFGFKLTENFDKPWMAANIMDFWRRWHISLANFVNAFIFNPVARLMRGNVEIGVLAAFVAMGLWHSLDLQYLIWGVAHGLAMAIAFRLKRRSRKNATLKALGANVGVKAGLRAFTLFYVAWLSMLANATSLAAGWRVTLKLIGLDA